MGVDNDNVLLYPAFSLNLDEEIEIFGNVENDDCCLYCPKDCIPIQKIMNGSYFKELDMANEKKKASIDETTTTTTTEDTIEKETTKKESSSQPIQQKQNKEEKEKTDNNI